MSKQVKKSTKVVGTNKFKQALVNQFTPNNKDQMSKSAIVQSLYNQYKKVLSQPKLTPQNLISAMRYIKKHNLSQSQYQEAIDKTASKESVLTLSQFSKIYDYVLEKRNVKYMLNNKNILAVYEWIFNTIKVNVNHGNGIRISGIGTFKGKMRPTRKYQVPNEDRTVKVKKHLVPKLIVSDAWKKSLRNDR